MLQFLLKRLSYGISVIFGVIVIVFFVFHALPGDPAKMVAGPNASTEDIHAIRQDMNLDKSLPHQLFIYFNNLSPISVHEHSVENAKKYEYYDLFTISNYALVVKAPYFGRSYGKHGKLVSTYLIDHLSGTLWLAFSAMFFASFFGVLFGIIAALKQGSTIDTFLVSLSVLGISVPSFVSASVISMVFGYYLSQYTGLNSVGSLWETDSVMGEQLVLKNIILPALTLGIRPLAILTQLTRNAMLDVLSRDFIRTAKAKGLRYRTVIFKHALKNALNPIITSGSTWLASLLAGAFFVEYVFNWKGLGYITIEAVNKLDLPVVMGATVIIAAFFILITIIVDIIYALIDPRVVLK
ncbi:MAG: ABC transporter permease [Bernardetiaceae bacterium]|nr:ABC transporter permease [Bernardetiaceae bacterium]